MGCLGMFRVYHGLPHGGATGDSPWEAEDCEDQRQ